MVGGAGTANRRYAEAGDDRKSMTGRGRRNRKDSPRRNRINGNEPDAVESGDELVECRGRTEFDTTVTPVAFDRDERGVSKHIARSRIRRGTRTGCPLPFHSFLSDNIRYAYSVTPGDLIVTHASHAGPTTQPRRAQLLN